MCRLLGAVARAPISLRHELLEAENPILRQAEVHDSGWGMAVYERPGTEAPAYVRFAEAAHEHDGFRAATELEGRIFNVHLRRATLGGLALDNTHPFLMGSHSFCHNGTIPGYAKLLEPGVRRPVGQTDSEAYFNHFMYHIDPADLAGSVRRVVTTIIALGPFSGLNFLFSDGHRLYAYRLGIFELHWLARPGQLLVASERVTGEEWQEVGQDVLLTLDPEDPGAPRTERLLGDAGLERAEIVKFEEGQELTGAARGSFAAERAALLAPVPAAATE